MTLDEELLQEAEDDRLTVEYIQNYLPQELKERFTEEELYYFLDVLVDYYTTSGILDATPDKDGYIGTPEMWEKAESSIKKMADRFKMDYFIGVGEAAMYGPKMDFMAVDAIGREWQLATVQLDYALPARFGLEYTDADGSKKTPIMVHCALIGSIERFMSVYLEHTAGWLPMWCAPENVRILTVNDKTADYVAKITTILEDTVLNDPLPQNHIRYTVDDSADSLGKKIRRATDMKMPAVLIVGPKDAEAGTVSVRLRDKEEKVALTDLSKFLEKL